MYPQIEEIMNIIVEEGVKIVLHQPETLKPGRVG